MRTNWIWPVTASENADWNVRLGRLLHWTGLAVAVIGLLVGLANAATSITQHINAKANVRDYDAQQAKLYEYDLEFDNGLKAVVHAPPKASDDEIRVIVERYFTANPWDRTPSMTRKEPLEIRASGNRPAIPEIDYLPLYGAPILAICIALFSRGLRYLFSGE